MSYPLYCAAITSYGWQIVSGSIFGIFFGILLIKNNFCDREKIRTMLRLAEGKMVATVAAMLFFGLILRFAACRWSLLSTEPAISGGQLLNSIFGGILCGVGLYICGFAPLSAIAGIGSGKLQVVWVLLGMLLAIPALEWASGRDFCTINAWNKTLPVGKVTWEFFDSGNPALYGVIVLGAVLLVTIFLLRRDAE